jgi:pyrimidine 5'-nucleotidase
MASRRRITAVFFDLDHTLYPPMPHLDTTVDLINGFLTQRLGLSPADAVALRRRYLQSHPMTICGLVAEGRLRGPEAILEYLRATHEPSPVYAAIQPNPALAAMLHTMAPGVQKWVLTNSYGEHVDRVLAALHCPRTLFDGVIDVLDLGIPTCKPHPAAFHTALRLAGQEDPSTCLFVDDSPPNLGGAQAVGLVTVHVGATEGAAVDGGDFAIPSVLDLPRLFPELWEA